MKRDLEKMKNNEEKTFLPDIYPEDLSDRKEIESHIYNKWYEINGKLDRPFYYHNLKNEESFIKSLIAKFNIKSGSDLIDIGCGNGLYAMLFRKHGIQITAVDISNNAIRYCINRYGKEVADWTCSDALELDYNETFDYGFCNFFTLFNMFDTPQQGTKYVDKIMKYIKKGGTLFFIWYSDLTAVRFGLANNRFAIMNFTMRQLECLFSAFKLESYAIDSMARLPIYLKKYAFNKFITRLSCAVIPVLDSSWKRVRIILVVHK